MAHNKNKNARINKLSSKFGGIKNVGRNGQEITEEINLLVDKMDFISSTIDTGVNDPQWVSDFEMVAGNEELIWIQQINDEIKLLRQKLIDLGL